MTFRQINYFGSGPSTTRAGALVSRDAIAASPGGVGVSVIGQGQGARAIEQMGTLIADTPEQLAELERAIAVEVGAEPGTLTDEHGRDWPGCVMRRFTPSAIERIGPRFALPYMITYLQTTP